MIEFLLPSLLAGLGIAVIAGPLGSFVVWRKMAYFGDTLAHASLLGIALGFLLHINLYLALVVTCIAIALFLVALQEKSRVSTDTLLGILAHSSLSLGLIALSFLDHVRVDLMSYLFGDLLAVNYADVMFIYAGVFAVLLMLVKFWQPLLSSTVNEELAAIEGVNIKAMRLLIMVLTGVVIAVGMKFVGALIISSLLIIPAATAHKFSRSPEQMAMVATLTGMLSVLGGLWMSWSYDTPAGPSVVCSSLALFIAAQLFAKQRS
jgi:zinc transport system permease protein